MSGNDDERSSSSSASSDEDSDYLAAIDFFRQKYPVAAERPNQNALAINDDDYRKYTSDPYVNTIRWNDDKLFLAHTSHEFMSSACLLPSISKSIFNDPSKIQRYQYIGNKQDYDAPIWSFRAKYFHDRHIYRFNVEEIDVTKTDDEKMAKRMYMLHYFKHDNLMRAYFTLSEPWIYRMNIALPNNVSLLKVSDHLGVRGNNRCPSIKYVTICILRALEYLHESNIVHGEVKIKNCFYDLNGNVLLGGFENAEICRQHKSYDIWNVGTTLLDYCFYTDRYGRRYPNPTCIEGYPTLFHKMLHLEQLQVQIPMDGNNNDHEIIPDPETRNFSRAHHQIIHNFATEEMYGFLLRVFRDHGLPSAATLLENDEFVGVSEDDFEQLKSQMINLCRGLRIKPFCANVPLSNLPKTIKPLDVSKEEPRYYFVYKTISPSVYRSYFKNPRYQFKNGSEIRVDFTIVSEIYDGSFTFNEVFKVGDERSIFKALFNLIKDVDENSPKRLPKILPQNGASRRWYPVLFLFQCFFSWDIFRLRAALDAILIDAANCKCDPSGVIKARRFPLCHHKKGISRHVDIKIHYSPADIIKIKK